VRNWTVERLCELFLASLVSRNKPISTIRLYRSQCNKLIQLLGGKRLARHISAYDSDEVYRQISDQLSVSSAVICCRVGAAVWSYGIRYGDLPKNPFSNMKLPKPPSRRVRWTRRQVIEFDEGCKAMGWPSLGLLARLCWVLAQRPIDMASLTWANWEAPNKLTFIQSKTGNEVYAELPDDLAEELARLHRDRYFRTNPDVICAREDTVAGIWTAKEWSPKLKMVLKKMGLPMGLQMRDLRRTAITEAGEGGATDAEMMTIGGIKDRRTLDAYRVPTSEQFANAQRKRITLILR
jgi:integrase